MARLIGNHLKLAVIGGMAALIALLVVAAPAGAATNVYPAGGSSFTGSAEGWTVKSATCNLALGCTASGGYDGANGNPPGSIAANTEIALTALGLINTTVTMQSPEFKVSGGSGTIRLDRQFAPEGLISLTPQLKYTVSLLDQTAGAESKPIAETVVDASPFTGKEVAVGVISGHTYAISVTAETTSSIAALGLVGTTSVRFDNVALAVQTSGSDGGGGDGGEGGGGGEGGRGGKGGNGLSSSQLLSLLRSSSGGTAVLKGKRLFVKAPCPAKIGRSCRLSLQGLLTKRQTATTKRTSKVAKGKAKTLVLKVKPNARKKLTRSNRLLFRETVRAGSAKATVYKRLKLIRRR